MTPEELNGFMMNTKVGVSGDIHSGTEDIVTFCTIVDTDTLLFWREQADDR